MTRRWREMDSNPRSPAYDEFGAPGRAHATRAAIEKPESRSFASASDLRHAWGAFHMDKSWPGVAITRARSVTVPISKQDIQIIG